MVMARKNIVVTDNDGNVVNGATIEVRREVSGAPLAALKSNRAGTVGQSNPFVAADGSDAGFFAAGGAFKITATKDGFSKTWRYEPLGISAETDDDRSIDFSIVEYGASEGAADNAAFIQAAIDDAALVGGRVRIPSGSFDASDLTNDDGVNIIGSGPESVLNYIGTGTLLNVDGVNLDSLELSDFTVRTDDTASAILLKIRGVSSRLSIHGMKFEGGKRQLQLAGDTGSGTYGSVVYDNNFEGNAVSTISIDIAPSTSGFAQSVQICFNNITGHEQALRHTSGDGVHFFGNRVERHWAATSPTIHADTSNGVRISGNYFEDESNNVFIESGADVGIISVYANEFYPNVGGGTHTGANVFRATSAAGLVIFSDNYIQSLSTASVLGSVVDTGASPVYGRSNVFNIGTASYGFASTATSADVDIDGTRILGSSIFSSALQQVGVARMAVDLSNYGAGLTGSGKIVRQTSPALITPVLGDASAHSLSLADAGVSPGGIALGATALVTNLHGSINFDASGALYTNGVAAVTFNTGGVALGGAPTAATAAVDTSTTQIATTAMVLAQAAAATPLMNGTAAVGTSTRYARADHVHPTKQMLGYASANTGAGAGSTGYFTNNFAAGEAAVQIPTAMAGTIKNVYFKSNGAPGGTETYTITLRKNNADTAITATITGAGTTASDLTHTVTYAAGDLFAFKVVGSGAAAAAGFAAGMEFDPS